VCLLASAQYALVKRKGEEINESADDYPRPDYVPLLTARIWFLPVGVGNFGGTNRHHSPQCPA
jgi:hypothetical protein